MGMKASDEILVPGEICEYLRITKAKFYYLATRGRLGFLFKVGNEWRARRTDLDDWIEGNTSVVLSLSQRSTRMSEQTDVKTVGIADVEALLTSQGYEVTSVSDTTIKIKDLDSGIVVVADLEDSILFFTVSCLVVEPSRITPDLMRRMLASDNGIATSAFGLVERPDGNVAITLSNFAKLLEMGADDEDDIMSCLQFLVMDVCAASELLADLQA